MKFRLFFQNIALLLAMLAVSCGKEDMASLFQRQTDVMTFSYLNSTQTLSVRSSEAWTLTSSDDWITVPMEPIAGNAAEQPMQISVAHNRGDQRSGSVLLSNGQKEYRVTVDQGDGNLLLQQPIVPSSFVLQTNVDGARIDIPYTKGSSDDKVHVVVAMQGPGKEGIVAENVADLALQDGNGTISVALSGLVTHIGEVQFDIHVEIPGRNISTDFVVKSRVKLEGGVDPLTSPTVRAFKLLPRLAVMDWGRYIQHSNLSRKFELELAYTQYGSAIRRYSNQVDWLSSTSVGTGMFFDHNRFAWANLKPNTTYWFRIIHKTINANNVDSDITYFEFRTPAEVLPTNLILYKDFDDFWFGGNPIYQAFGVQPTEAQLRTIDPNSDAELATDYRTNSPTGNLGNVFVTTGNLSPASAPLLHRAYWDTDRYGSNYTNTNYKGWYGVNALPNTGGVRLATASAQGYIQTPALENIGEATSNLLVTTHTAAYFEPYHSWGEDVLRHYIMVIGEGRIVQGGSTMVSQDNDKQITVQCASNVDPLTRGPLYDHTVTTKHQVQIQGATKDTRIRIMTLPYSGTGHFRIWVDDIAIQKQ